MVLEAIYIVRHGYRTHWIVDPKRGTYSNSIRTPTGIPTDPPLASYGVKQAHELASHLSAVDPPVDLIYCSPYYRCLQTLEPFIDHLASTGKSPVVHIDSGLSEFFGRAPFLHPRPATLEILTSHFKHLSEHPDGQSIIPAAAGESIPQLHDRVAYCYRELIRRADADPAGPRSLLVCSHAASIICAGRVLTGRMPDDFSEEDFGAYTCGLTTFVRRSFPGDGARQDIEVKSWNPEHPDDVPNTHWRDGVGIEGGWDCVTDSDCSFLEGGAERGWHFSGDESFMTDNDIARESERNKSKDAEKGKNSRL